MPFFFPHLRPLSSAVVVFSAESTTHCSEFDYTTQVGHWRRDRLPKIAKGKRRKNRTNLDGPLRGPDPKLEIRTSDDCAIFGDFERLKNDQWDRAIKIKLDSIMQFSPRENKLILNNGCKQLFQQMGTTELCYYALQLSQSICRFIQISVIMRSNSNVKQ